VVGDECAARGDEFAEVLLAEHFVAEQEAFVGEEVRGDARAIQGWDAEAGPVGGVGVDGGRTRLSAFAVIGR
jgi:hypothetical protein